MKTVWINKINIKKVRHLENLEIPLSDNEKKHLIITGKNGSGKTSLLVSLAIYLNSLTMLEDFQSEKEDYACKIGLSNKQINIQSYNKKEHNTSQLKRIAAYEKALYHITGGVDIKLNEDEDQIYQVFQQGNFIVAFYKADRTFEAEVPRHIEKVELKNDYRIDESPRNEFVKYLSDLKMTQALANASGKKEKADQIERWFLRFEKLLAKIFEDDSIQLVFDEDTFQFSLQMNNREPFDFNTLSSGYAALLDIVVDMMMRMEKHSSRKFDFTMPGIVLIDEIETHLHLELQKTVLPLLTELFPNIQFIVSTHSPFILSSLSNAMIYDLENKVLVENGLTDIPYSGIVEGYFHVDELSAELKEKFEAYKNLSDKKSLSDDDMEKIAELELYLNEIPDYLALNLTTEYQRLKQEFRKRDTI